MDKNRERSPGYDTRGGVLAKGFIDLVDGKKRQKRGNESRSGRGRG